MEPKNLYIRIISLNNRKSCSACKNKLNGQNIFSAGEYQNAKWKTVEHFCRNCFPQFSSKIKTFTEKTEREVILKGYQSFSIPDWMVIV